MRGATCFPATPARQRARTATARYAQAPAPAATPLTAAPNPDAGTDVPRRDAHGKRAALRYCGGFKDAICVGT
ncbi:hypothetical protein LEN_1560 [Lysobacter enzymogenes]|uniref:Uncharacterized protein n=1 Tax=Lysobacter enzymogenes TaxID=69 RepID=A0AAU9AQY2_LYSEN|nr:hypothetical protein LEN_1560 [Lysobacter enzymogenes]